MGIHRTNLSQLEKFNLMLLIQEEYATAGKNDEVVASYAREKLSIPKIKTSHVWSCRESLGIPSTNARRVRVDNSDLEERVKALEILAKRFRAYMGEAI